MFCERMHNEVCNEQWIWIENLVQLNSCIWWKTCSSSMSTYFQGNYPLCHGSPFSVLSPRPPASPVALASHSREGTTRVWRRRPIRRRPRRLVSPNPQPSFCLPRTSPSRYGRSRPPTKSPSCVVPGAAGGFWELPADSKVGPRDYESDCCVCCAVL